MNKCDYSKEELWLHKFLECIYQERGESEISNLFDIVNKHMQEETEMGGQILDFIYDKRRERAKEFFGGCIK